jgi:ribonuclease HI
MEIETTKNITITISHIKSHCGVYGNVKADRLAKKSN